jgi:protein-disulfide isomerase
VAHLLKKSLLAPLGLFLWAQLSAAQPLPPAKLLAELPGFDFKRLEPAAQAELVTVLTDEFDSCGRPLTLLASLKKGDACRHTRRMVGLAAGLAAEGAGANEIIVQLSKYNQTFGKPRATFKLDPRTCLGSSGLGEAVTIVEFSDFECPSCALARPVLERFAKDRPGVRLCWSAFPLEQHPHSILCGQAALFARDAGKFWAVHDALFEHQLEMSPPLVRKVLEQNGLDVKAFDKAVAQGKYVDELKASREAGKNAGVDGTPALFVNGRRHPLGTAVETLSASVDDELDWITGNGGWPTN